MGPQQTEIEDNFAYSDREILSINKARNIKDGFTYFKGLTQQGSGQHESGILIDKDGNFLRDNDGRLVIELPASASQQSSPIKIFLEEQIGFINQVEEKKRYPVKILFPYKLVCWHWNVGEIIINKNEDNSFDIFGCKYDPRGSINQLEPNMWQEIQDCLNTSLHGKRKYSHSGNCGVRIATAQTGNACGMYAAIAMHNLKTKPVQNIWDGIFLSENDRHDEKKLRDYDYELIKEYNPEELYAFCTNLDSAQKPPITPTKSNTKPHTAQPINSYIKETKVKDALIKWFSNQNLSFDEKEYINAAKETMRTQIDNPRPNQAYTGIGVDVKVSDDKTSLKIADIFSPDTRFNPTLSIGESITAVKVDGKMMVSIQELIEQDPSFRTIAKIFHDVSNGAITFEVEDSNKNKKDVTCSRDEKSCFVTSDCKEATLALKGKRGEKFNPEIHSVEVFGTQFAKIATTKEIHH